MIKLIEIIRWKDSNGNFYYSDIPVKTNNAELSDNVSAGKILIIQAGRVVNIIIQDLILNKNQEGRTLIATNLFKPINWCMCVGFTNKGIHKYVELYLSNEGDLYVEQGSQLTIDERLNGSFTYISRTLS